MQTNPQHAGMAGKAQSIRPKHIYTPDNPPKKRKKKAKRTKDQTQEQETQDVGAREKTGIRLPPELQMRIFQYYFSSIKTPVTLSEDNVGKEHMDKLFEALVPSATHDVAAAAFWEHSIFCVVVICETEPGDHVPDGFRRALSCVKAPLDKIRHLVIDFKMSRVEALTYLPGQELSAALVEAKAIIAHGRLGRFRHLESL